MKAEGHPKYQMVVFKDISTDFSILTRSTVTSKETIEWEDGKEYPLVKLELSSASHPFFTGKQHLVDTAGRVEKFLKKYGDRRQQRYIRKFCETEYPKLGYSVFCLPNKSCRKSFPQCRKTNPDR